MIMCLLCWNELRSIDKCLFVFFKLLISDKIQRLFLTFTSSSKYYENIALFLSSIEKAILWPALGITMVFLKMVGFCKNEQRG